LFDPGLGLTVAAFVACLIQLLGPAAIQIVV
jgi:hypothetical protein